MCYTIFMNLYAKSELFKNKLKQKILVIIGLNSDECKVLIL